MTTVSDGLFQFGGMSVTPGVPVPFTGNFWWVNPANGVDGNTGKTPGRAFATLYRAHQMAVDGNNDVIVLVGNGLATGSARLSAALAASVDSTATTGTLKWTKNATHLIGVCAPTSTAQRSRIAPPTGTYTQATFGSANFVTVTGSGCYFSNFSLFHGFSTGDVNQICWTDNGSRNCYVNVDFGGIADAASAASAGSRSLKIGSAGSGENTFMRCTIGLDTVARTAANSSIEFAGGTPRNRFIECLLPCYATGSGSGAFYVLGTGASCIDRWQSFERCAFINNIKSGGSALTAAMSLTNASPGGLILIKDCTSVGATKWGDTNALANSYVDGGPPTNSSTGLAVNPS